MNKKLFLVLSLVCVQLNGAERALEAGKGIKNKEDQRLYLENLLVAGALMPTFGTFFVGSAWLTVAGSVHPGIGVPIMVATIYPLVVAEHARRRAFKNLPPELHKKGQRWFNHGFGFMGTVATVSVLTVSAAFVGGEALGSSQADNLTDGTNGK